METVVTGQDAAVVQEMVAGVLHKPVDPEVVVQAARRVIANPAIPVFGI